jgi:renalase
MRAAVVGAGISGLHLANRLSAAGVDVDVFDKARGPSGRISTRRTPNGAFDHGAPFFTARDPVFVRETREWLRHGVAERWNAKIAHVQRGHWSAEQHGPERYVGVPRMSAIARHLAAPLSTTFSRRVVQIARSDGGWTLETEEDKAYGAFDLMLIAVPAPQAALLLADHPEFAIRAKSASYLPTHALMVRFDSEIEIEFDAFFVKDSAIRWAARNASKPGRDFEPTWVLHSTPEWSRENLETSPEQAQEDLLAGFSESLATSLPGVRFSAMHRWLYSRLETTDDAVEPSAKVLWDPARGMGICGDWVRGDGVENAYLSAEHLAAAILDD